MNFEIRGDSRSQFQLGFQTGLFSAGTQADYFVVFGADKPFQVSEQWKSYSIPLSDLMHDKQANLADVTGLLFFKGDRADGKGIEVRNLYWSKE